MHRMTRPWRIVATLCLAIVAVVAASCDQPVGPAEDRPGETIAFVRYSDARGKIYAMRSDGSNIRPVRATSSAAEGAEHPTWSPDGRKLAFVRFFDTLQSTGAAGVYTMNDDGSSLSRVFVARVPEPSEPRIMGNYIALSWSPDGDRLAFAGGHIVHAQLPMVRIYTVRLDGSGLTSTNPIVDTLDRDDLYPTWSSAGIAFSSNRAFTSPNAVVMNFDLYVMSPAGQVISRLTQSSEGEDTPDWSPQGSRIVFTRYFETSAHILIMNADGTGVVPLTAGPHYNTQPSWSGDGTRIAFASDRDGNSEIYVVNADGTGLTRLTNDPAHDGHPAWRPKQ